jgi:hypothetical protein
LREARLSIKPAVESLYVPKVAATEFDWLNYWSDVLVKCVRRQTTIGGRLHARQKPWRHSGREVLGFATADPLRHLDTTCAPRWTSRHHPDRSVLDGTETNRRMHRHLH